MRGKPTAHARTAAMTSSCCAGNGSLLPLPSHVHTAATHVHACVVSRPPTHGHDDVLLVLGGRANRQRAAPEDAVAPRWHTLLL
eukprot:366204-Chlamydomonas_euryale.AAC.4